MQIDLSIFRKFIRLPQKFAFRRVQGLVIRDYNRIQCNAVLKFIIGLSTDYENVKTKTKSISNNARHAHTTHKSFSFLFFFSVSYLGLLNA